MNCAPLYIGAGSATHLSVTVLFLLLLGPIGKIVKVAKCSLKQWLDHILSNGMVFEQEKRLWSHSLSSCGTCINNCEAV